MKDYVVWLDSEDAHIFYLNTTGIEKSLVKRDTSDHHRGHKNDQHDDRNQDHYFMSLCAALKDSDQLLLMGPGLAKTHFKDYLEKHQPNALAKKIIGIETVDHITENQVMAVARNFFKHYDLFNKPI